LPVSEMVTDAAPDELIEAFSGLNGVAWAGCCAVGQAPSGVFPDRSPVLAAGSSLFGLGQRI